MILLHGTIFARSKTILRGWRLSAWIAMS